MATIDPSIALGIRPPQIEPPMNALARVMQVKAMQQEMELGHMKMDETRRGVERRNQMFNILSSGGGAQELRRGGFLKESMDMEKSASDIAKDRADTAKNSAETALKKISLYRDAVNGVNDPQAVAAYITAMHADPDLKGTAVTAVPLDKLLAQVPADPAQFQDFKRRFSLGAEKYMADERQRLTLAETQRHNRTSEGLTARGQNMTAETARRGQDITMRGQDLTDQRQRDQNNIQSGQKTQQGVMDLRKEFNALPDVKKFREVLPVIQSVQRAPDTPAGDIDLIYGVGKVMDPESVVREGEMTLVIKSGSPAQRVAGYYNYVKGGGRLTPAQRQELVTVLNSRVEGLKSNYDAARKTYETAADRVGLPKDQIFIENDMPPPMPVDFGALPSAGKSQAGRGNAPTKPKVVNFGDLK